MINSILFNNFWDFQQIRHGEVIREFRVKNGVTVEGKNYLLNAGFGGATAHSPWYMGLISSSPTPSYSEDDTLASHAGWTEITAYAGNRKEWVDATAANKVKGTTSTSDFTMNATGTIVGAFIASVDTGTSGVLWATGSFPVTTDFVDTDVFKASYSIGT